jgi:flagellar biosynthesis/type III secretory pathway protein FliH
LPLTQEGKRLEVVEEAIQSLQQAGKDDLLPLLYAWSALIFNQGTEQQWLRERFKMMEDILEDSWAYQEMVQKGMNKGLEQGLQQGLQQGLMKEMQALSAALIRFVETHFPDQLTLAKQQVELMTNSLQVQEMLDKLFVARTSSEVREILLSRPQ